LAVLRHELTEEKSGRTLPCRVIFVFSTAGPESGQKNREKSVAKLRSGLEHIARSVEEADATRPDLDRTPGGKLFGDRQAAAYFQYQMIPLSKKEPINSPPRDAAVAPHAPFPVHLR